MFFIYEKNCFAKKKLFPTTSLKLRSLLHLWRKLPYLDKIFLYYIVKFVFLCCISEEVAKTKFPYYIVKLISFPLSLATILLLKVLFMVGFALLKNKIVLLATQLPFARLLFISRDQILLIFPNTVYHSQVHKLGHFS